MHDNESAIDKALTLLGSAVALLALFTLCSVVPEALLAITH